MITRAVFSYFNPEESFSNRAGFKYYSDLLYTMALSTFLVRRHFESVQMVTSTWGEKIFRKINIPVTEYNTALDDIKSISPWFWAYGKLIAYILQKEPFIHIDNDVMLYTPLPQRILNAELCFQSKEFFSIPNYKWYDMLKPCWNAAIVRPQTIVDNEITNFTYNCGICGGHNLEFFKEWLQCSSEYIFAPENQKLFFEDHKNVLMHQNLFHEQYFAASLIKSHSLTSKVEVIVDDITNPDWKAANKMYTHLWGGTKKDQRVMKLVKNRLLKESPELYNRVTDFVNSYLVNECRKDVLKIVV